MVFRAKREHTFYRREAARNGPFLQAIVVPVVVCYRSKARKANSI